MKPKNNEIIKDILFMIWGFIGGGICFFLLINIDFKYVTGSFLKIGEVIHITFIFAGLIFVVLLFLAILSKIIARRAKLFSYY